LVEVLQIAQLGNPILRKISKEIKNIDKDIDSLSSNMIYTVQNVNGAGLAAPQVFESKSMFIMASKPNDRYPNAPQMEPTAIINPKLIASSEKSVKDWEGCLSIPGIRGLVTRNEEIEVEYTNISGAIVNTTFGNFAARIFQHEYDHLQGIVFLDRVESNKELITELEYQKLVSGD
jgi:peptide deformylase